MKKSKFTTLLIVQIGVMSAIIFVITYLRFPLFGSKVHFANTLCLVAGMLLGPLPGGLAAGFGSAIYDLISGYDIINVLITFVSKFLMAFICSEIAYSGHSMAENKIKNIVASVVGALSYVALYMLKTFIYQAFVYGYPMDAVWLTMSGKLPASLINAALAIVAAPIIFTLLHPAMKRFVVVYKK